MAKKRKGSEKSNPDSEEKTPIMRLKRYRFHQIKKDPDFITFVRIGRATNAIAFGLQSIYDYTKDQSPIGRRQYFRSVMMSAGYLHETILLLESLRLNYLKEEDFKGLYDLAFGLEYREERKVLKKIRDTVAFHLDSKNEATPKTLAALNLKRYALMSGKNLKRA